MGEYLLSDEEIVLRNLMLYPPVEGSRESHEAWKQSVYLLIPHTAGNTMLAELRRLGFISATFRNACISYAKALPSERKC